jgi:hypothetical protein
MRTRSFQLLLLAWSVLVGAGCHRDRPARSSPPLVVSEPCSPAPQLPLIFYDENGTASKFTLALSELELREIIGRIAAQTKDLIWFIRVKPSVYSKVRGGAIVYLRPQRQTPRIRTGHAYSISPFGERTDVSAPWKYVQVSRPDQTFASQLSLPSTGGDLLFPWPDMWDPDSRAAPMSEEEIARIVDFVREPSSSDGSAAGGLPPGQMTQSLPIMELYRYGDTIQIAFGYQHAGRYGSGLVVTLERTPTSRRVG